MKHLLSEHAEFLRQFRATFHDTGAIAPSSRFVARAITQPLRARPERPIRVLEVGPGTGAITRHLVPLLREGDHLDLVELNPQFIEVLQRRLQQEEPFRNVAHQVGLHHCAIQDFHPSAEYDYVISGLPLNNFTPELVEEIFDVLLNLAAPGGYLSYFEYMYVRTLRRMLSGKSERDRLRRLEAVINPYLTQHRVRRNWVFGNLPPAWVQHLILHPDGPQA